MNQTPKVPSFDFVSLMARAVETGKTDDESSTIAHDRCRDLARSLGTICDSMRDTHGLRPAEVLYTLSKFSGTLIHRLSKNNPELLMALSLEVSSQVLLYATDPERIL